MAVASHSLVESALSTAAESHLDFTAHLSWASALAALAAHPASSDICIASRGRVRLKVRGVYCIPRIHSDLLSHAGWLELCRLIHPECPPLREGEFVREGGCRIGSHRLRVSRVRELGGEEFSLRVLPTRVPTPTSILLPRDLVRRVVDLPDGLVVFAGGTGHGKSTSIAALVGENSRKSAVRVITIEDPIEYLHEDLPNGSTFTFRELGAHAKTFASALRDAMRMRPDIIVVGEIRDAEAAEMALEASLTGHKVITTIHGGNVEQAMQRLADFASDFGSSGVGALAQAFQVCVAQKLVSSGSATPLVPIHEILTRNPSVVSKIRGDKIFSLGQDMESGEPDGMQTFAQSIDGRRAAGMLAA